MGYSGELRLGRGGEAGGGFGESSHVYMPAHKLELSTSFSAHFSLAPGIPLVEEEAEKKSREMRLFKVSW